MSGPPEISVIVGAWNRREHLRAAVRSLEGQTLGRDRFEILVTKNFQDDDLDRPLEAAGATLLFDTEPAIGRFLHHAIDRAQAPWVTFLDDDDEYEPGRLERILAVARDHPDLGFYRNRVVVIDRDGRPVPASRWRVHEADRGFDALGPVYLPHDGKGPLFEIATRRTFATFNNSSMAIRRNVLDGALGEALDQVRRIEDTFLFLVGAIAPVGVFLDDQRLTRFRYYGGNVSGTVRWFGQASVAEAEMARLADAHGQRAFADWFRALSVHHRRMELGGTIMDRIAAGARRADVVRLAHEYFRYLADHPAERKRTLDTWAAGLYGVGYVVLPSASRRLARARITSTRE
jgi:glycosyltransferase involved in cell wall biosynthesis